MDDKKSLRRALRLARKTLPENIRRTAEQRTNRHLKACIKRGKRIGAYWAFGSELQLNDFIMTAQKRGAQVFLPYIEPRSLRLWFTPYPVSDKPKAERKRSTNQLHIPQFYGKKYRAHQLNTLILPIVGIDSDGYRLGNGGGYYDSTLAACLYRGMSPRLLATGFSCQRVAHAPHETHDQRVHNYVSEHGWQRFNRCLTKQSDT